MQGGMHITIPQIPTLIPIPARQEQTKGGTAKAKQPPTVVPAPPKTAPTADKHVEHAIGPASALGSRETSSITTTKMALLLCIL
jgi:hypothetical protein